MFFPEFFPYSNSLMTWCFLYADFLNGNSIPLWSHSVVVSTPDFESGNLGSNPGETLNIIFINYKYYVNSYKSIFIFH